jgi:hypothetical protein
MTKKQINWLIGIGIFLFLIGFLIGFHWFRYLQLLIPIGSFMTFAGVIIFFIMTDLDKEFSKKPTDDYLTFFWNVLALKVWTFILMTWMIVMNIMLITEGLQ